jgi:hypothetical protein
VLKVNSQKRILSIKYKILRTRELGRPRYRYKSHFKCFWKSKLTYNIEYIWPKIFHHTPLKKILVVFINMVRSSSGLSTGRTDRGSRPVLGGEVFRTFPHRPWGPPRLLYNAYRVSFQGIKQPRPGVDHPPASNAEVKERVELYLWTLSIFYIYIYIPN